MIVRTLTALAALSLGTAAAYAAEPSHLGDILKFETLGAQVAWLESQVGPAFKIDGAMRVYKVDGCELDVEADKAGEIDGFRMETTKDCALDLKPFLADAALPATRDLTFGAFETAESGAQYSADCLTSCGYAYDPSVYATWEGGHVNDFVTVVLEAKLVNDDSIGASMKWADQMKEKEGEGYVVDTKFNCDHKYDDMARGLFKTVKVTAVSVGQIKAPITACTGDKSKTP